MIPSTSPDVERQGRGRWLAPLWLLLVALLGAALCGVPVLREGDWQWQRLLTRIAPSEPVPSSVTLIDIDERSLQTFGPWPWPRPLLARLSQSLRQRGARLQIWDMFFSLPTAGDAPLVEQLRRPDVVIGQVPVLDPRVHAPPLEGQWVTSSAAPPLCSQAPPLRGYLGVAAPFVPLQVGHLASTPDSDGQLRRLPAVLCGGVPPPATAGQGAAAPHEEGASAISQRSAQLVLAAVAADTPGQAWSLRAGNPVFGPTQWLRRGDWAFPLDERGDLTIPYQRPHDAWPAISASQLLDPTSELPSLQGHIVLIGGTALGLRDVVSTPFHPNAPGLSIHAELLAAGAAPGRPWPGLAPRGAGLLAGLVTLLAALLSLPLARRGRRPAAMLGGIAAVLLVPLFLSLAARLLAGLDISVAAPISAMLAHGLFLMAWQIQQQRRRVGALSRQLQGFMPPTLARQVAAQAPGGASGRSLGQPCDGVLAAVRIAGLQRWVSRVDTLQGLALIHALHSTAANTLTAQGGQLEHAQGEVFYVSWPRGDARTTRRALDGLRQLLHALAPILESNARQELPLTFYAALESGAYLLGLVGAHAARRSVLLGPVANDVVGMLGLCEELDSPILIGPRAAVQLMAELGEPLQGLGRFVLPDQQEPKILYRVPL